MRDGISYTQVYTKHVFYTARILAAEALYNPQEQLLTRQVTIM